MGDIAQRGNRLTAAKGGRIGKFGGGRTNLLEELGRVEAEPSNRNRRAEISRVHGELNRGYAKGGRAGFSHGRKVGRTVKKFARDWIKKKKLAEDTKKGKFPETESLTHQKGPYVGDVGSERPGIKRRPKGKERIPDWPKRPPPPKGIDYDRVYDKAEELAQKQKEPGTGYAKGGKTDKKWIQKAVDPKHKGYCTPMTKKTCTPARKALARTFKKKAKTGW